MDIASSLIQNDSRVKIITHEQNKSQLQARLSGVKASSAKSILFLDADDYLDLNAAKTLLALPFCDWLCFGCCEVSEDASQKNIRPNRCIMSETELKRRLKRLSATSDYLFFINGILFNKKPLLRALESMQGWYFNLGEDTLLSLFALYECQSYSLYDLELYFYRYVKGSMSHSDKNDNEKIIKIIKNIKSKDEKMQLLKHYWLWVLGLSIMHERLGRSSIAAKLFRFFRKAKREFLKIKYKNLSF